MQDIRGCTSSVRLCFQLSNESVRVTQVAGYRIHVSPRLLCATAARVGCRCRLLFDATAVRRLGVWLLFLAHVFELPRRATHAPHARDASCCQAGARQRRAAVWLCLPPHRGRGSPARRGRRTTRSRARPPSAARATSSRTVRPPRAERARRAAHRRASAAGSPTHTSRVARRRQRGSGSHSQGCAPRRRHHAEL